jgi:hypothetical protein
MWGKSALKVKYSTTWWCWLSKGCWVFSQQVLHEIQVQEQGLSIRFLTHLFYEMTQRNFTKKGSTNTWLKRTLEECRLLGYNNPFRTSQETHYFATTDSSQLMLCKIWGSHGSDCEECRLLGYKNSVRTSQETHYFSATEISRLILCKIRPFHGGNCDECRLLGCYAVWLL